MAKFEFEIDCPRSGPGLVWALFVDPGPGPGPVLDLDLESGSGHEYCNVLINNN